MDKLTSLLKIDAFNMVAPLESRYLLAKMNFLFVLWGGGHWSGIIEFFFFFFFLGIYLDQLNSLKEAKCDIYKFKL